MWGRSGSRKSTDSPRPQSPRTTSKTSGATHGGAPNKLAIQALGKQLSQLDGLGKQLDMTISWVKEHAKDSNLNLTADAPKEAAQLAHLRKKLEQVVKEISSLAGAKEELSTVKEKSEESVDHGAVETEVKEQDSIAISSNSQIEAPSGAANDGGTVQGSVSKILGDEAAALSIAKNKVTEEHKRLTIQMKELHDLEMRNQELKAEMSKRDVRLIRDEVKILVAKAQEVQVAESELLRAKAMADRLPLILSELESLQGYGKLTDRVLAAEEELKKLREQEARCSVLSSEILRLGPKVAAMEKLSLKAEQMNAEAVKAESLQARISALQGTAEQLPSLRTRLNSLQSSAAEAKRIQQILKVKSTNKILNKESSTLTSLLLVCSHPSVMCAKLPVDGGIDKIPCFEVVTSLEQLERSYLSCLASHLENWVCDVHEKGHSCDFIAAR